MAVLRALVRPAPWLALLSVLTGTLALAPAPSASGADAAALLPLRVALYHGGSALASASVEGVGVVRAQNQVSGFAQRVEVRRQDHGFGVRVDGTPVAVRFPITVEPRDAARPLVLNGVRWRGAFEMSEEQQGLRVLNLLDLEDYVKGVVPNEMFPHLEALKVQAIVSRTLAVYIARVERRWEGSGFDLSADGQDQVYRGLSSETALSNLAVGETAGMVLTHADRVIFSAYDANSGGHTEVVDVVWPGSITARFPYLAAVPSPLDRAALSLPGYEWAWEWARTLGWSSVRALLARAGHPVGEVQSVRVVYGGVSQRVLVLEIMHSGGTLVLQGADRIRLALGLPSARAIFTSTPAGLHVEGRGLGHGVGLSQHGAWGMAREGRRADEILGHYYRDVRVRRIEADMIRH